MSDFVPKAGVQLLGDGASFETIASAIDASGVDASGVDASGEVGEEDGIGGSPTQALTKTSATASSVRMRMEEVKHGVHRRGKPGIDWE
jgi:hypothetical protein